MCKFLQHSVVTQTMLGGLSIYPPFANSLLTIFCLPKNGKNLLTQLLICRYDITIIIGCSFWPTLCESRQLTKAIL